MRHFNDSILIIFVSTLLILFSLDVFGQEMGDDGVPPGGYHCLTEEELAGIFTEGMELGYQWGEADTSQVIIDTLTELCESNGSEDIGVGILSCKGK